MKKIRFCSPKVITFLVMGLFLAAVPMTVLAEKDDHENTFETATPSDAEYRESGPKAPEIDSEDSAPGAVIDASDTATGSNTVFVETKAEEGIIGTWTIDGVTGYRFDEADGTLILPAKEYAFTYTLEDDQLLIDFEDERAADGVYTIAVEGKKLILRGGEGTNGGVFELKRTE